MNAFLLMVQFGLTLTVQLYHGVCVVVYQSINHCTVHAE